jgi:hypothetical protein
MAASSKPRWFYRTPDCLVVLLLVVELLLLLSNWLGWWHEGYAVLAAIVVVGVALLLMLLWFIVALIFRRRFQFSLRTLLALVVVVALPFSWLAVEMKMAREHRAVVEAIQKLDGGIGYDWEFQPISYTAPVSVELVRLPSPQPPEPPWLRSCLGDNFFANVVRVHLFGEKITDEVLANIARVTQLHTLELFDAQITDAGMAHIARLTQLHNLRLYDTRVSDAGLQHLAGLPQLEWLCLSNSQVTDAGLAHLARLPQLHNLILTQTRVTDAGVAKLKQALPKCRVYH